MILHVIIFMIMFTDSKEYFDMLKSGGIMLDDMFKNIFKDVYNLR